MNKIKLVPFQGLPELSDEEEQVSVLSDEEQEDQLAEMQGGKTGTQEEVQQEQQTEASLVSALSDQQLEQEEASENQRPGLGALSAEQPEHTSPAQTSVSQRHVRRRRRRKKKVDPAFVY